MGSPITSAAVITEMMPMETPNHVVGERSVVREAARRADDLLGSGRHGDLSD
jgi:hypothetical protein